MAKQRITPGGTIDVPTEQEMARMFAPAEPKIVIGMGGSQQEKLVDDIPMRGVRRLLTSFNRGDGSDNFIVPAAQIVDLCDFNGARIAGTILNIGANPVYVYLSTSQQVSTQGNPGGGMTGSGIICGYLFANGGNWDFELSRDVWCGPVSAYSTLGSTLVWGVH